MLQPEGGITSTHSPLARTDHMGLLNAKRVKKCQLLIWPREKNWVEQAQAITIQGLSSVSLKKPSYQRKSHLHGLKSRLNLNDKSEGLLTNFLYVNMCLFPVLVMGARMVGGCVARDPNNSQQVPDAVTMARSEFISCCKASALTVLPLDL